MAGQGQGGDGAPAPEAAKAPRRRMPRALAAYVRIVEAVARRVGRATMYLVFAMMGILLWSAFSKAFLIPPLWAIELAQFTMAAYYILGGAYAMQTGDHVRMDLLWNEWTPRGRAWADALTAGFLIFYLVFLVYGGFSSTAYALEYGERSYSAWRPYMAPIKIVMVAGCCLMLAQAVAMLIRDVATIRGEEL